MPRPMTSASRSTPRARIEEAQPRHADGEQGDARIAQIQRTRLMVGAIRAMDELGYPATTVADITNRARVSRRTFYELFANREECLVAVIENLAERVHGEIAALDLDGLSWRERVRAGLGAIVAFLDREPQLARVCMVQALRGGVEVLETRERILAQLAAVVDEGRQEHARGANLTPLTAEGLVGAAFAMVHTRLLRGERRPLHDLQSELIGLIVLPYLGAGAARREQARLISAGAVGKREELGQTTSEARDPLAGVPMRLTYRTTRVLVAVAEHGGASNRIVAEHAGIADQGQVSKLLARLERLGLLANAGGHLRGEANAWMLTPRGKDVARSIGAHMTDKRAA